MNLETFFQKFDQFADAPDAVAKIRELILHLAFTGGIIDDPESRATAENLLTQIDAQKESLVKSGELRKSSTLFPLPSQFGSEGLPRAWSRVPLGRIATMLVDGSHNPPPKRERGIPMLSSQNILNGTITYDASRLISEEEFLSEQQRAPVAFGDVLLTIVGTIGRSAVVSRDSPRFALQRSVALIRTGIDSDYLCYYLRSPHAFRYYDVEAKGTAQRGLYLGTLSMLPVPVAPLAEQKRIVAKVDELMALCDRLEAQQKERETRHAALARASLARFAAAPTPGNLNLLFHPSYAISPPDLRKSILTLAVQGLLVPHESEGADWRTRRLMDVTTKIGSGSTPLGGKASYQTSGVPLVRSMNVHFRGFVHDGLAFLNEDQAEKLKHVTVKTNDVLLNITGASIGRVTTAPEDMDGARVNQHVCIIRPNSELLPHFLVLFLASPAVQDLIDDIQVGATREALTKRMIERFEIPLPSLAEQRRIVAKTEQLMALVDELETQIAASRATASNLLTAVAAELTGTKQRSDGNELQGKSTSMRTKADTSADRAAPLKPFGLSTQKFVLRRFKMDSGYRSLGKFDCTYHTEEPSADEASPICLVGLNGSGKSNLIEAVAEVFCFLELINLPWKKVAYRSSRYRENRHRFQLDYTLEDEKGERLIRIKKTKNSGAEFFVVNSEDSEEPIEAGRPQLLVLPRRIVGYSSGLNETVSHPFLRTKTIYSEEVRDAAPPEGVEPSEDDRVFDTRTLYMDYESNAAILIANYIFCKPEELAVFEEFTRVRSVSSFGLRFNRKRAGRSGPHKIVRLTHELQSYLESFSRCAGAKLDSTQLSRSLNFELTPKTIRLFREEFKTAETLFMAMHKWSLLNALILSDQQRNVYLSNDITKGALERPPSVPPSDRVFNIVDLRLNLSTPEIEIDYSGLSDGEHQFVQVFGTALLFSEPGTLFLFDEPESHFNPEWRTKFNLILNRLPNASRQEYIISTHSPFIVSGSRMGNVYKFTRNGAEITIDPVKFETYGASFDDLLKKLFSVNSLIDQSAREELEEIIKEGDVGKMQDAVEDFAESKEKRRLYEALIKKEG